MLQMSGSELLERNPLLKRPALTILEYAKSAPSSSRELIEELSSQELADERLLQPVTVVIDVLIRNNMLAELISVSGKPSPDGTTLSDLSHDASFDANAKVQRFLNITQDGEALLDRYDYQHMLGDLLQSEPSFTSIYLAILAQCKTAQGSTRSELEQLIDSFSPATDGKRIYPQYFLDTLESAGGIVWDRNWQLTDAGKAVLLESS